jgi:hypothetical protein
VADDGSRYAAIWDASTGPPSVARHGLNAREYQQEFDKWTGQGYCPTLISGYQVGNDARYAAIFEQKKCPAFVARFGLTSQAFEDESNTLVGQRGYRLKLVNGYNVAGVVYYAAIWEQAPGTAIVERHGLNAREYQEEFGKWTGQGYCLTHLSGYSLGNALDLGLQALDHGGIEHRRLRAGLAPENLGRLADDASDLAVRHGPKA